MKNLLLITYPDPPYLLLTPLSSRIRTSSATYFQTCLISTFPEVRTPKITSTPYIFIICLHNPRSLQPLTSPPSVSSNPQTWSRNIVQHCNFCGPYIPCSLPQRSGHSVVLMIPSEFVISVIHSDCVIHSESLMYLSLAGVLWSRVLVSSRQSSIDSMSRLMHFVHATWMEIFEELSTSHAC